MLTWVNKTVEREVERFQFQLVQRSYILLQTVATGELNPILPSHNFDDVGYIIQ
jgi:hypothetical protein